MYRPWETNKIGPFQDHQVFEAAEVVANEADEVVTEPNVKKRRHLHSDAKELIFNLHDSLIRRGCPHPIKEASDLLQLSCSTVQTILQRGTPNRKKCENRKNFSKIDANMGKKIEIQYYICQH